MKRCQWIKPVLVVQVKFTEWTHDNQLRQPVFLGLRTDKDPKDVVREGDKMP
jgi:bifunctional non-homologous end joining protein LigD